MKKRKTLICSLSLTVFMLAAVKFISAQTEKALPQLGKNSNKEVIAAMTLEEKASQLVNQARAIPSWDPFYCCS